MKTNLYQTNINPPFFKSQTIMTKIIILQPKSVKRQNQSRYLIHLNYQRYNTNFIVSDINIIQNKAAYNFNNLRVKLKIQLKDLLAVLLFIESTSMNLFKLTYPFKLKSFQFKTNFQFQFTKKKSQLITISIAIQIQKDLKFVFKCGVIQNQRYIHVSQTCNYYKFHIIVELITMGKCNKCGCVAYVWNPVNSVQRCGLPLRRRVSVHAIEDTKVLYDKTYQYQCMCGHDESDHQRRKIVWDQEKKQ